MNHIYYQAAWLVLAVLPAAAFGQAQPQTPESTVARPQAVQAPASSMQRTPTKSPGTAVLLSLLIPGGGQLYTRRWWQAALIAPTEVTLGSLSFREHLRARAALAAGNEDEYVRHRDRRTVLLWWTGATLVFSMAHAYVSAQMYEFDRQMTFSLGPTSAGVRLGI
ncbi:MAG: DUF5683 domain-containing protein [candidate division WOR-3 bacterium]